MKAFAHISPTGKIHANTVHSTERGAMVNALVTLFGVMVYQHHSDKNIVDLYLRHGQGKIMPVEITIAE